MGQPTVAGAAGPATGPAADVARPALIAQAQGLLTEVAENAWGQVAVGFYDTSRLVALAPWLDGHRARLEFLCDRQRADGGWGAPDGYDLVPTMSATAALLTELRRSQGESTGRDRLAAAARSGWLALHRWLQRPDDLTVPDTIAVELIAPALWEELAALATHPEPVLGAHLPPLPPLPDTLDGGPLAAMRARFAAGDLPAATGYCVEVLGPAAAAAPFVAPAAGAVGCSAAATAAWVGGPDGPAAGREFLVELQARGGGGVPGVTPITFFEASWVLNSLAVGGLATAPPAVVLDRIQGGLTADGCPASPGLAPDADDTAAVLTALLRHGRAPSLDPLRGFRTAGYFRCFTTERNPSVSTNAHVLEAFALWARARADADADAEMTAQWLLDQQRPDGSWWDKWHASGYYATACCVLALHLYGHRAGGPAIARAVAWLLDSQRADGSWGRWGGSVEETAYAVQTLALTRADPSAIARGCAYLADPPPLALHPPLWHAKDLYLPVAVVRAARLAALNLGFRAVTVAGGAPAAAGAAVAVSPWHAAPANRIPAPRAGTD